MDCNHLLHPEENPLARVPDRAHCSTEVSAREQNEHIRIYPLAFTLRPLIRASYLLRIVDNNLRPALVCNDVSANLNALAL
jgi:hypothetical protein